MARSPFFVPEDWNFLVPESFALHERNTCSMAGERKDPPDADLEISPATSHPPKPDEKPSRPLVPHDIPPTTITENPVHVSKIPLAPELTGHALDLPNLDSDSQRRVSTSSSRIFDNSSGRERLERSEER